MIVEVSIAKSIPKTNKVDVRCRYETPAGDRGKCETPQAKPRRLASLPAESEYLQRTSTVSKQISYYLNKLTKRFNK
ncbi:hypothetical protein [Bacillus sp. FJAT-45066]|uniref:hypothetical protein n=1 Tax=Bacillus sp. FJAT-45066 TaxID=2011010 RepID=UPI000BB732C0|nr:hypothetical protein [Bacillus sp. FJAT-45066]